MGARVWELVKDNFDYFVDRVREGKTSFRETLIRLHEYCLKPNDKKFLWDEKVWVYLVLNGFCFGGDDSLRQLYQNLARGVASQACQFWVEALPEPPREKEGFSHIDIACGSIGEKGNTLGGIEYLPPNDGQGSICFVEAKFLSDISVHTTYDHQRNQLARVIESALCIKSRDGRIPEEVFVTLLTPEKLRRSDGPASRLYAYKYREYSSPEESPDLSEAIGVGRLQLNWVTFERLIKDMPASDFKSALIEFVKDEATRGTILEL